MKPYYLNKLSLSSIACAVRRIETKSMALMIESQQRPR